MRHILRIECVFGLVALLSFFVSRPLLSRWIMGAEEIWDIRIGALTAVMMSCLVRMGYDFSIKNQEEYDMVAAPCKVVIAGCMNFVAVFSFGFIAVVALVCALFLGLQISHAERRLEVAGFPRWELRWSLSCLFFFVFFPLVLSLVIL